MRIVNMNEARTHLSRLVEAAANGGPFVARAGKPVVKVVAVDAPRPGAVSRLGFLTGRVSVPDDFDRAGAGDIEALFGDGGRPRFRRTGSRRSGPLCVRSS